MKLYLTIVLTLVFNFSAFGQTSPCAEDDYDCRIAVATKAIKANPRNASEYVNRANALDDKGAFEEAINDYDKAIELDPKDVLAYLNRGLAYYAHGNLNQAITDYTKVIALEPDNGIAYQNRANAYDDSGNFAQAIKDYNKSIELNPDSVLAYLNRGIAYYKKSDFVRALGDLTKTIELSPNYATAYKSRAMLYEKMGEKAKSEADYKRFEELTESSAESSGNAGKTQNPLLKDTTDSKYKVGQMWSYKTRQKETGSYFIVLKVENHPQMGNIIHIFVGGLKMKCRQSPECLIDKAGHLPFSESAVDGSAVKLLKEKVALPDYKEGYNLWREAFDAERAGVYTVTIDKAVEIMEATINP